MHPDKGLSNSQEKGREISKNTNVDKWRLLSEQSMERNYSLMLILPRLVSGCVCLTNMYVMEELSETLIECCPISIPWLNTDWMMIHLVHRGISLKQYLQATIFYL